MTTNTITPLRRATQEAQALRQEGRHAEALDILEQLVKDAPDNLAVAHNYAAALGDAGRNREARSILKDALGRGLNTKESWLVYARALLGLQEFDAAERAFQRVFGFDPIDHNAHREYAQLVWMRTGDREKSLSVLNQALARFPNNRGLHISRAQVFGQTGAPEAEYAVMREAARLSDGDPYLQYGACSAALTAKEFDAAVEYGRQAFEALPEIDGVRAAYCTALLATNRASEASVLAEQLWARDPFNQFYIALQATAWRLLGDERYEALYDFEAFVKASELDTPKGWSRLEAYVEDLAEALEAAHRFMTHPFYQSVRHGSQISSIEGSDNPAIAAFREAAMGPVNRYVATLGPGDDILRRRSIGAARFYSSWSISLPSRGYHVDHVHPQGWLSSACHVRPATPDPLDPHGGWLKFGEPGVATAPALEAQKFVEPQAGVMVIFPSYMWHGTVQFSEGPPRLTVAVDIVPAKPA